MELKHSLSDLLVISPVLLIVPYGIETVEVVNFSGEIGMLLIVPYGIETTMKTFKP